MIDLSIIVPVYNVEEYVRPCLESIFKQGLDDSRFEVIIVNDGSTDHSMEMIVDIIQAHSNITVINQENLSLSVARNNGIAVAKGEYIMMPDSDDLLIENSLAILLDKALETKVDIVVADFLRMTSKEIDSFKGVKQDCCEFKEKSGEQLFLEDLNPNYCYVWRNLYRKAFIEENHIRFIPGIRYQDVPFTHECYLKAGKCIKASWLLNIYRIRRPGSNTTAFSLENTRSFSIAIGATWLLRTMKGLSYKQLYKLEEDVFTSFSRLIYHTIYFSRNRFERNSVMDFLKTQAPHLNFTHSIRQRCTTFMFKHIPHFFINTYHLYAKIVHKHGKN